MPYAYSDVGISMPILLDAYLTYDRKIPQTIEAKTAFITNRIGTLKSYLEKRLNQFLNLYRRINSKTSNI